MDELRTQQTEALQVAHEYSIKLINGIKNVADELEGSRLPDTDTYLNEVVNGLNWIIEVTNGTMSLINEESVVIEKDKVNDVINSLSEALKSKDDMAIADILKNGVLGFVTEFEKISAGYSDNN